MNIFVNCVILSLILSVGIIIDAHSLPTNELLPNVPKCGVHGPPKSVTFLDPLLAGLDFYPWTTLLEYSKPNNTKGFHCAGSLISKRYVVTAAHCVRGKELPSTWNLTSVRLGEYDLLKELDCEENADNECNPPVIDVPISEKIIHELYDPESKNYANDIALVRLLFDVEFSDVVRPICLRREIKLSVNNYENISFTASGWYKRINEYSVKLKGTVTGVNLADCSQTYNTTGVSIQDTQFCGETKYGLEPCKALSGSPIMRLNITDRQHFWNLAGFVSVTKSRCGEGGAWPDVYTRIDSYVDWIESKLYA